MTIDTVRVGPFTVNNVDCAVLPPDKRDVPLLLGQSFINQFTHKIDNGRLLLSKVEANEPQGNPTGAAKKTTKSKRSSKASTGSQRRLLQRPPTGRFEGRPTGQDRIRPLLRLARGLPFMHRLTSALLISLAGIYPHEARAMDAADPIAALVQGNNAFALDLYARLGQGEGNRFISPFSISTALAMTYAGAQDETALEIAKALRFTLPPSQVHSTFHKLLAELHGRTAALAGPDRTADVQLFTANALWTQAGEHILADFQKRIEVNYQGGLYPVDFKHAPEEARQTINAWVEQSTKGKIKDLLKSTNIDQKTLLIITNAIYFKALWASPFSKERTSSADFHASGSDLVRVDMMKQTARFRFNDEASFQGSSCRTRATRWRW